MVIPYTGTSILGLEGTKHPVPDDESRSIIFVNIPVISSMVYTVVRGRSKEEFNYPRELHYILCMNPELVKHFDLVTNEENNGVKSSNDHREKEYDLDVLGPSQTKEDTDKLYLGEL